MQFKSVTWNIGGGKYLKEGEDPLLMASYSVDAVSQIADWLMAANPEVITLQEVQGHENSNQIAEIARFLGYEYYFFDATSPSHIDEGKTLGNGVISKYPLSDHSTGTFFNPGITADLQGKIVTSHDKGYGACSVSIDGLIVTVMTLHLIPFRAFDIDLVSETGKAILRSVEGAVPSGATRLLIQGDFNINTPELRSMMAGLFSDGMEEIFLGEPTTPSGKRYDHVLYKGLSLAGTRIDHSVKTDHYPVICNFRV